MHTHTHTRCTGMCAHSLCEISYLRATPSPLLLSSIVWAPLEFCYFHPVYCSLVIPFSFARVRLILSVRTLILTDIAHKRTYSNTFSRGQYAFSFLASFSGSLGNPLAIEDGELTAKTQNAFALSVKIIFPSSFSIHSQTTVFSAKYSLLASAFQMTFEHSTFG